MQPTSADSKDSCHVLRPVWVFWVAADLALFPKLLLSGLWLFKCYEVSKEVLFYGLILQFWWKGESPALAVSWKKGGFLLWPRRAAWAWGSVSISRTVLPPLAWRSRGKMGSADFPHNPVLAATLSPDVIPLRISDSAFGVLTCLFVKRTFNCPPGHADLLLYGKKLHFYCTAGLCASLGCCGLRSFPLLFIWSHIEHRDCRPRPRKCY